eukprot:877374-Rhodomonas_salina.2
MGLGESDTEIEKEQSEAVICGDSGSDDDDGILFQQDSEDGTRIEIPCSVAHFFHATFECESYTPGAISSILLSIHFAFFGTDMNLACASPVQHAAVSAGS